MRISQRRSESAEDGGRECRDGEDEGRERDEETLENVGQGEIDAAAEEAEERRKRRRTDC